MKLGDKVGVTLGGRPVFGDALGSQELRQQQRLTTAWGFVVAGSRRGRRLVLDVEVRTKFGTAVVEDMLRDDTQQTPNTWFDATLLGDL